MFGKKPTEERTCHLEFKFERSESKIRVGKAKWQGDLRRTLRHHWSPAMDGWVFDDCYVPREGLRRIFLCK